MRRILSIILLLVTITLFSYDGKPINPVIKIGIESSDDTSDSIELRDYLRSQVSKTNRGEVAFSLKGVSFSEFSFDRDGNPDSFTRQELKKFGQIDKLTLVSSKKGYTFISLIDVNSGKLEYKNGLPDRLTKTLVDDFVQTLDRKNIQLALQMPRSTETATVQLHSIQSNYRIGEPIRFELESNEDRFVYVVVLPENGQDEPVLLFPNSLQKNHYLKKGDRVTIPDIRIAFKSSQSKKETVRVFTPKEEWKDIRLGQGRDNLYKIMPQAITGTKSSDIGPLSLARSIFDSPKSDFEFLISTN
ncbi:MAG: DUF4384 domain-containing protein [Leptospira sp.]|nr:DUF4384 domain-containing protein [Leptospira sp.]